MKEEKQEKLIQALNAWPAFSLRATQRERFTIPQCPAIAGPTNETGESPD